MYIIGKQQANLIKDVVLNSINNLCEVKENRRYSKHSLALPIPAMHHLRIELNEVNGVETSVASFITVKLAHPIELPCKNIHPKKESSGRDDSSPGCTRVKENLFYGDLL